MSRAETPADRAERILAELREATREAAGVLKDLQRTIASGHAQIEEYARDEISSQLVRACNRTLDEAVRVCKEHEDAVTRRVIDYAALIENNFSRDALVREAVNHIEERVAARMREHQLEHAARGPEVVISMCDRPHAD